MNDELTWTLLESIGTVTMDRAWIKSSRARYGVSDREVLYRGSAWRLPEFAPDVSKPEYCVKERLQTPTPAVEKLSVVRVKLSMGDVEMVAAR